MSYYRSPILRSNFGFFLENVGANPVLFLLEMLYNGAWFTVQLNPEGSVVTSRSAITTLTQEYLVSSSAVNNESYIGRSSAAGINAVGVMIEIDKVNKRALVTE